MIFLAELKQRNKILYWCGIFNFAVGIVCMFLLFNDDAQVAGVNRWLKPMKFYFSVGLLSFTMGWLMHYLHNQKKVLLYSWLTVVFMLVENGLILLQAIRNTTSHFNIKTKFDGLLFVAMGVMILLFTILIIIVTIHFFAQKKFNITPAYLWGIRLGLVFFIIASIEGGFMISLFKHTVGGADGGPGLPLVNWSTNYGDLRIAHFFGLHALQILPLIGFYVTKNKNQLFAYAAVYFVIISALFVQALKGIPLFF